MASVAVSSVSQGYSSADDESVDQLANDDDAPALSSASGSQPTDPEILPLPPRSPGSSYFPSERLESILQAEGTTGSLPLTKEGLFLLSIATEQFIKRFAQSAESHAAHNKRDSLCYPDMSSTIAERNEFRFLQDIIPVPIPLQDALSRRTQKLETDIVQDDSPLTLPRSAMPPSLQQLVQNPGNYHYHVHPHALAAASSSNPAGPPPPTAPSKGKSRMTNGKSKLATPAGAPGPDASTVNSFPVANGVYPPNVLGLQQPPPTAHPPANRNGTPLQPSHNNSQTSSSVSESHPTNSHHPPSMPPPGTDSFKMPSPWQGATLSYTELKSIESLANDLRRAAVAEAAAAAAGSSTPESMSPSTTPTPSSVPDSSVTESIPPAHAPPPPSSSAGTTVGPTTAVPQENLNGMAVDVSPAPWTESGRVVAS